MRTNITGRLEKQIETAAERHGFKNGGEYIRYAVRKELERKNELCMEEEQ